MSRDVLPQPAVFGKPADLEGDSILPPLHNELRVLTLNVWMLEAPTRRNQQVAAIRKLNPDIVCLQEAFSMRLINAFRKAFSAEYEMVRFRGRCSIGAIMVVALFYSIIVAPWFALAAFGINRVKIGAIASLVICALILLCNPGEVTAFLCGNRTGLLLLVRRDRIIGLDTSAHFFQEWKLDYLNLLRPRGFLCATGALRSSSGDLPFQVLTSHLDQQPDQPKGRGRFMQSKELMEQVSSFDGLTVLAGDLNFDESEGGDAGPYRVITEQMEDAWDGNDDPGITWDQIQNPLCQHPVSEFAYGAASQHRYDYVFWRQKGRGRAVRRSCEVVFKDAEAMSDHYGVLAVFEV